MKKSTLNIVLAVAALVAPCLGGSAEESQSYGFSPRSFDALELLVKKGHLLSVYILPYVIPKDTPGDPFSGGREKPRLAADSGKQIGVIDTPPEINNCVNAFYGGLIDVDTPQFRGAEFVLVLVAKEAPVLTKVRCFHLSGDWLFLINLVNRDGTFVGNVYKKATPKLVKYLDGMMAEME